MRIDPQSQPYYSTSGQSEYTAAGPVRILDTRNGTGGYSSPVESGKAISLQVTGQDGVPASGVTAVVPNLTATGPTSSGWVIAYPNGQARSAEGSDLNFTKGETIPNQVIVPVGADGKIDQGQRSGRLSSACEPTGLAGPARASRAEDAQTAEVQLPAVGVPPGLQAILAREYHDHP